MKIKSPTAAILNILFLCMLFSVTFAASSSKIHVDYDEINELEEKAKKYVDLSKELLSKTLNATEKDIFKSQALKMYEMTKNKNFQSKIEKYKKLLMPLFKKYYSVYIKDNTLNELLKNYPDLHVSYNKNTFHKRKLYLSSDEKIYIFVSSSIPVETLRNFVKDASMIHGEVYFVLRGGIRGLTYIKPTLRWIIKLMKKDLECNLLEEKCKLYRVKFQINPLLFKEYNIDVVPQVVYIKGENETVIASPGAVPLPYHLKRIGEILKDKRFINFSYCHGTY